MAGNGDTADDALLKAILQESDDEVLVFDRDTLRIVQVSAPAARGLDSTPAALRGRTLAELFDAADLPALDTRVAQLRAGSKRCPTLPAQWQRPDGSLRPVSVSLVRAGGRDSPLALCIARTPQANEFAGTARGKPAPDLRAIVAHLPGMAYQVLRRPDGTTSLCYVSEQSAQLLGIKAATLRADPERFARLIVEEDRPDYLMRLDKAGGSHMTFNWEGRIWLEAWKDVKWVNIRVSPRETPRGQIWDGIMLNVTRSKEAEAEIRLSRAKLAALAAHVETVKEQERLYLAREVHDDLGGNLAAIKIGLSWLMRHLPDGEPRLLERTLYLDNIVDQTIEAAHRIASNLRPAMLDFGIVTAIDWQLQRFGRNTEIACTLQAPEEAIPLGPDASIAVFRIVQEALTNVAKHARASRVKVSLARDGRDLVVSIADNGRGMQAGATRNGPNGFGILGMSERATALGGALGVQPVRPHGTEVVLRVPLADSPAAAE